MLVDPRFAHPADRKTYREELRAEVEAGLARRTAKEWEEILSDAGVPAARVLSVPDALGLEQLTARGFLHRVAFPDGRDRPLEVLGSAIQVDGEPAGPGRPPPLLGEHTDTVLAELGYGDREIEEMRAKGAV
ncbi:CoA transferase [Streptomyces sp. NPDC050428]|uniref:CoA transferase n=1 Tax=Streptomyces sp. NPDC050428 TaxID=3155757 RepID=UPI00343662F2